MPYIPQARRNLIGTEALGSNIAEAAFIAYREAVGQLPEDAHYHERIIIYGMLCGVAAEFYRQHVAPYEDRKCQDNGDVT